MLRNRLVRSTTNLLKCLLEYHGRSCRLRVVVQKTDKATQERLAELEKELQIEKESSQAAMLALKKELNVEKESSKAALKQVLSR